MAINFPTSLDTFTNPTSSDTLDSPDHAVQHSDVNDAVEALEAKVGVDSSAVTTSHDYILANKVIKNDAAAEYTATLNFNATTLADGATINWDLSANQVCSVTLAGNRTLAAPTNFKDGATYILIIKQDATGTRTLTFNPVYKFPGGTAPTLTTAANAVDIITFISDGTNMYGVSQLNFS